MSRPLPWPSDTPWPAGVEPVGDVPVPPGFVAVLWPLPDGRKALGVLPDPDAPNLTASERLAVRTRNAASITGRCACGAVASAAGADALASMVHEDDCPAISKAMRRAARKLGGHR